MLTAFFLLSLFIDYLFITFLSIIFIVIIFYYGGVDVGITLMASVDYIYFFHYYHFLLWRD